MATADATSHSSTLPADRPGFGATLLSEWTKLRSVRSTYIFVGLAIILSVGMTALMSFIVGSTWEEWPPDQRAQFNPVLFSLFGNVFYAILISVLGVTVVTNEYSSGMMRLTLTATPRRGRVLMAKVILITAVALVTGAIATLGMLAVGLSIFSSYGMESTGLTDDDAVRALIGVILVSPAYPVVGAAIAVLLRSTAGAITAILALIFAPGIFGGLLPAWWQENVLSFVLGPVTDSIAIQHLNDSSLMFLDVEVAVVALAAWLAVFVGGAYLALKKRDA